jgi:hypothetical protein
MKPIPNNLFFLWVEQEIADGRSVRFRLKGTSMLPLLRGDKDEIILYPCKPADLHPLDVILFRYKGNHLLHRIIKIDGNHLYIQGDGSFMAKEECDVKDVVGKVHAIVRPSGRMVSLSSCRWKLLSFLWVKITILKKIMHIFVSLKKKI